MRPNRWVVVLLAGAVVAGACSSRGKSLSTSASTARSTTTAAVNLQATDVGVTPTEVRIAVIADVDNPVRPGLFKTAFDGVAAWAAKVNDRGGLAGRKVVVDKLDSKLSPDEYRNAVIKACQSDFAIIGTIAVFDNAVDDLVKCGIPDLPSNPISNEHRTAPNTYPDNPANPAIQVVGQFKWVLANVKGCCAGYWLVPNQPIARESSLEIMNAATEIGVSKVHEIEVAGDEANYTPIVLDIKSRGATFVYDGLDYTSTVRLRKEAQVQGVKTVNAWVCVIACYTPSLLTEGGSAVEGEYVWIYHMPFEEATKVRAIKDYVDYTRRTGGEQGEFGINAYGAGLLLEQAVKQIVVTGGPNGLKRSAVLEAVRGIHDFTGDGVFGVTDVGARKPPGCFVMLQVRSGKFVRVHPSAPGTIDCNPANLQPTHVVQPGGT